jgi:hypothetical protein
MAQTYAQRFGSSNYNWPSTPKNSLQVGAMAWTALSRARQNYLNATKKSWTVDDDVLPDVNRIFDSLPKAADTSTLTNTAGAIQGYSALFKDNGEIAALNSAATILGRGLAAGYYSDTASPPFYFYVDNSKVIVLGSSRGPINKTFAAGTQKYNDIVAALKTSGRPADKGTAEAAATGPSTSTSAIMPAAVTESSGSTSGASLLDRVVSDPVGTVMDVFKNPYVIGGTVLVASGLAYWFFFRDTAPKAVPMKANKRRRHSRKAEVIEVEDEDVDVDPDEVEVEDVEEVEETPRHNRTKKHGSKHRRHGRK